MAPPMRQQPVGLLPELLPNCLRLPGLEDAATVPAALPLPEFPADSAVTAGAAAGVVAAEVLAAFVAATWVAGAEALGSNPAPERRAWMQAMKPALLLEQLVAAGPTITAAITTRLKIAAPTVTASGLVGAGSASCLSSRYAAAVQKRPKSGLLGIAARFNDRLVPRCCRLCRFSLHQLVGHRLIQCLERRINNIGRNADCVPAFAAAIAALHQHTGDRARAAVENTHLEVDELEIADPVWSIFRGPCAAPDRAR